MFNIRYLIKHKTEFGTIDYRVFIPVWEERGRGGGGRRGGGEGQERGRGEGEEGEWRRGGAGEGRRGEESREGRTIFKNPIF